MVVYASEVGEAFVLNTSCSSLIIFCVSHSIFQGLVDDLVATLVLMCT